MSWYISTIIGIGAWFVIAVVIGLAFARALQQNGTLDELSRAATFEIDDEERRAL